MLVLAVLVGGTYFGIRMVKQNHQLARELALAKAQQLQLAGAEQVMQLGLAAQVLGGE